MNWNFESDFVYNNETGVVTFQTEDQSTEIWENIDETVFEQIQTVDILSKRCSGLLEVTVRRLNRLQTISKNELQELQQESIDCYQRCLDRQSWIESYETSLSVSLLEQLYKLEKFLKDYFRLLSVAEAIQFSQQLLLNYHDRGDSHLSLFVAVRNICSTSEYLFKLVINRMGDGSVELNDSGVSLPTIYERLMDQGLGEPFDLDSSTRIPYNPNVKTIADVPLSSEDMNWLYDRRNDIVHHCPLFVPDEQLANLPDEFDQRKNVFTEDYLKHLFQLSSRLGLHTASVLLRFTFSYLEELITKFVETIYEDNDRS